MSSLPPVHRPFGITAPAQRHLQRNREADGRRGSARQRGYTARWDRAAKAYLYQHPLCVGCAAIGRTVAATTVDHIEPHRGDMVKFWDRNGWQGCCSWHHDTVKQRMERMLCCGEATVADMQLSSALAIKISFSLRGNRATPTPTPRSNV